MKCPGCGKEFIADADTALCPECEAAVSKARYKGKVKNLDPLADFKEALADWMVVHRNQIGKLK